MLNEVQELTGDVVEKEEKGDSLARKNTSLILSELKIIKKRLAVLERKSSGIVGGIVGLSRGDTFTSIEELAEGEEEEEEEEED